MTRIEAFRAKHRLTTAGFGSVGVYGPDRQRPVDEYPPDDEQGYHVVVMLCGRTHPLQDATTLSAFEDRAARFMEALA